MRLKSYLLSGVCLTCIPVAGLMASPQADDITVTAVVRVSEDGEGGKDAKEPKDEQAKDGQKERKTLRLEVNKGPVVLMKRLALTAEDNDQASKETEDSSQEEKEDDDKAEATAPKIWLGIGLKEIEGDLATYLGSSEGVFIESIFPDSPAADAKLQEGDIVIAFHGTKVLGPLDLVDALRSVKAKEADDKGEAKSATYPNVSLTVLRRGQEIKVELTPRARPENLKLTRSVEEEELLDGANIFKIAPPEGLKLNLTNPQTKLKSSLVVVVKEDGDEYIARVERDGDGPAKIIVTHDKKDRELREDQLDQLPEKVREAIKRALKAGHMVPGAQPGDDEASKAHEQALGEVQEQLEKAMKHLGGGKIDLRWQAMPESLDGLRKGQVIIIDPAKLQELGKMPEEAKAMAKRWAEAGAEQARGFSNMPEQVKQLKKQVDDLRKEVEELREELKASKK